jgi:hypothetical protein
MVAEGAKVGKIFIVALVVCVASLIGVAAFVIQL